MAARYRPGRRGPPLRSGPTGDAGGTAWRSGGIGTALLRNSRIVVLGAGGIAGALIDLAALGIGRFTLIDDDFVSETNIGTADFERGDVGKPKIEALAAKIRSVSEWAEVETFVAKDTDLADSVLADQVGRATIFLVMVDDAGVHGRANRTRQLTSGIMLNTTLCRRVRSSPLSCGRLTGRFRIPAAPSAIVLDTSHESSDARRVFVDRVRQAYDQLMHHGGVHYPGYEEMTHPMYISPPADDRSYSDVGTMGALYMATKAWRELSERKY